MNIIKELYYMSNNHSIEMTETYVAGFKTALLLEVESSQIKF